MAMLPTLTRDQLWRVFRNEEVARAFEALLLAVRDNPDAISALQERVTEVEFLSDSIALGSFQRPQAEREIREGNGISISRDAGGVTLSVDERVIAFIARSFVPRAEPAPPPIDSAQIVLLSRTFGARQA